MGQKRKGAMSRVCPTSETRFNSWKQTSNIDILRAVTDLLTGRHVVYSEGTAVYNPGFSVHYKRFWWYQQTLWKCVDMTVQMLSLKESQSLRHASEFDRQGLLVWRSTNRSKILCLLHAKAVRTSKLEAQRLSPGTQIDRTSKKFCSIWNHLTCGKPDA